MRSEAYLEIGQKRLYVAHERERIELIDLRIVRDDEQIADELLEPLLESSALRALFERRLHLCNQEQTVPDQEECVNET